MCLETTAHYLSRAPFDLGIVYKVVRKHRNFDDLRYTSFYQPYTSLYQQVATTKYTIGLPTFSEIEKKKATLGELREAVTSVYVHYGIHFFTHLSAALDLQASIKASRWDIRDKEDTIIVILQGVARDVFACGVKQQWREAVCREFIPLQEVKTNDFI